mmetsp:Transcript_10845/g.16356  ORF Transcript_10845/g.16356 Transcript_10845/m.16356 type:complete len:399 (-) Transcript_10845:32-1228(-)
MVSSSYYCEGVRSLAFDGGLILYLALAYFALITAYCVAFVKVAVKQKWPDKFLAQVVRKRVQKLQEKFPGLRPKKKGDGSEWNANIPQTVGGTVQHGKDTIHYDGVVSQAPYIASTTVDDDLTFILANNGAFGSVSSYCSCTVRGYALLSTLLTISGCFMGFLWVHNTAVSPISSEDRIARYSHIVGYFLVFLTGLIMCAPTDQAVYRTRNIALWFTFEITNQDIVDLHPIGIFGFIAIPMCGNIYLLATLPHDELPPEWPAMVVGIVAQVVGIIAFVVPGILPKLHIITGVTGNQLCFFGEIFCLIVTMLSFIHNETYTTAVCADMVSWYYMATAAVCLGTLALFVFLPPLKSNEAAKYDECSVVLMHKQVPVALSGPTPVQNFDSDDRRLPRIKNR